MRVRNVPPVIPRHHVFSHKQYILDEVYTTKTEADRQVRDFRSMGHNARFIHSGSWYLVYQRAKE